MTAVTDDGGGNVRWDFSEPLTANFTDVADWTAFAVKDNTMPLPITWTPGSIISGGAIGENHVVLGYAVDPTDITSWLVLAGSTPTFPGGTVAPAADTFPFP